MKKSETGTDADIEVPAVPAAKPEAPKAAAADEKKLEIILNLPGGPMGVPMLTSIIPANRRGYRRGLQDGLLTSFRPDSLEFENSIAWDDYLPLTGFTHTAMHSGVSSFHSSSDVTPLMGDRSNNSTLIQRHLQELAGIFQYVKIEHSTFFADIFSMGESPIPMGRTRARPEKHYYSSSGTLDPVSIRKYFNAATNRGRLNDAVGSSYSREERRPVTREGRSLAVPGAYASVNERGFVKLINVFQSPDNRTICLSYINVFGPPTSAARSSSGNVSHFWFEMSPEAGGISKHFIFNNLFSSHGPSEYVLNGFMKKIYALYLWSFGLGRDRGTLLLEYDGEEVEISLTKVLENVDGNILIYIGFTPKVIEDLFIRREGTFLGSRGNWPTQAFGLKVSPDGKRLELDPESPALRDPQIRIFAKMLIDMPLSGNPLTANTLPTIRRAVQESLRGSNGLTSLVKQTLQKRRIDYVADKVREVKGPITGKRLNEIAAQPEFRQHMPV